MVEIRFLKPVFHCFRSGKIKENNKEDGYANIEKESVFYLD